MGIASGRDRAQDGKASGGGLERMPTGIAGFENLLGGGLPRHRTTLLLGGPGSGKTLFALQPLLNGTRRGETMFVSQSGRPPCWGAWIRCLQYRFESPIPWPDRAPAPSPPSATSEASDAKPPHSNQGSRPTAYSTFGLIATSF